MQMKKCFYPLLMTLFFFIGLLVFSLVLPLRAGAGVAVDCEGTKRAWENDKSLSAFMNSHTCSCSNGSDKMPVCVPKSGSSSSSGIGGAKGSSEAAVKQALVQGIIGGLLNPPPPKKAKSQAPPAASSLTAAQHKINQQLLAEKAAQEAAYAANQQRLILDLKGDIAVSRPNVLDLKAPPETSAVRQLGLLDREGRQAVQAVSDEKRSDWENPPKNLPAAIIPKVPEPSSEVKGERSPEAILKDLLGQITTSRQKVDKLDKEVKQLEEMVVREERKAATEKKADDDALSKAREALKQAKENRERTAAELRKLEEQTVAARSATKSATASPQQ
jgi:hypothetical protein